MISSVRIFNSPWFFPFQQDPQRDREKMLQKLLRPRVEFKPEDFTLQDLLAVLPGPSIRLVPSKHRFASKTQAKQIVSWLS